MATALTVLQTLVLIAGLALLGQFVVGLFNWQTRQRNPVWQLFNLIASPVVRGVRRILPRAVTDARVPVLAFALLLVAYVGIGWWHRDVCLGDLTQAGCEKWLRARGGGR